MTPRSFLRYLLLPATPVGLLLIAFMTLGLALVGAAGWLGVPMGILLLSWLFKYAYVLLEQVAHGAHEPPVLSIEMLNPAAQLRPWLLLIIIGAVYLGLRALDAALGAVGRNGSAVVLTPAVHAMVFASLQALAFAALPACIAVLGIAQEAWQALNPLALWQVVRALGASYLAIVAVLLLYGAGLALLGAHHALPQWLDNALLVFAGLSVFSLIGGSVFEARDAIGLEAIHAPERAAQRARARLDLVRARMVDGAYAQARSGNLAGAWHSIEQELSAAGNDFQCYDWLLERLLRLEDQRLAERLAQDYIRQALGRDNGRVVDITRQALARNAQFRPRSAAETARVAQLLRLAGHRSYAQQLLADSDSQQR